MMTHESSSSVTEVKGAIRTIALGWISERSAASSAMVEQIQGTFSR